MVLLNASNASCQEQEGLNISESEEIFNLVDTLEYDLTICRIERAYQDSLHSLEIERLEAFWAAREQELKTEKRRQFFYAGLVTVISAVSVWVGARAAE